MERLSSWIGAALFPSPAKVYILRRVRHEFRTSRPKTILDVASADFKYRFLFPGAHYTGLDIDAEMISRGQARYFGSIGKWESVGVCADISKAIDLPAKYDMVVSLHTLDHLAMSDKKFAVEQLAKSVRKDGLLIIQASNLAECVLELGASFAEVDHFNCGSLLTQRMEDYWGGRVGKINPTVLTLQLFSFIFAIFASFVEPRLRSASCSQLFILRNRLEIM